MNENMQKAQEYRKSAEKHLASVKSSLRTFFITGVFVISGVVIFVFVALAWFANKREASAEGMSISAKNQTIELRSHGKKGVHDDVLKNLLGTDGEKGFWYSEGMDGALETSRNMPSINWLLTDESNMGNYDDGKDVDWSDDANKRIDYAIEPGSAGNIDFYIVPKVSGNITVKCDLSMIPYQVTESKFNQIPDDSFIIDELRGHILFFLHQNNSLQWISDKEFLITIPNAVSGEEYLYTLHWSWPQIFGEIILSEKDTYLNNRQPIYSEYDNGADVRTEIVEDMKLNPQKYFYSSLTKLPLNSEYAELDYMQSIHEKTTDELLKEGESDAIQAFVDLSSYYNQADQYIGKNIDCIRVSLTAELYKVEN